jgi:hypothetical protein
MDSKVYKEKIMLLFYDCSQFPQKHQFYVDSKRETRKFVLTCTSSTVDHPVS